MILAFQLGAFVLGVSDLGFEGDDLVVPVGDNSWGFHFGSFRFAFQRLYSREVTTIWDLGLVVRQQQFGD